VPFIGQLHQNIGAGPNTRTIAFDGSFESKVLCLDNDVAPRRHRIARVDHKVHDYLLELPFVGPDRQKIGIVIERQPDFFSDEPVQEMGQIRERVAQIKHLGAQILLAGKRQKLAHQSGRAIGILMDLDQIGIVLILAVMAEKKQIAVARNHGKKIVEIMGNPASELADGLHLLTLNKLRFERFELGHVA
jgi:transposase